MLDFALWLCTSILLGLLQLVDWLTTPAGLAVLAVLGVAGAAAALRGYLRRRRRRPEQQPTPEPDPDEAAPPAGLVP